MFTTEAVSNGLPVHIASRILGHRNINATQAYLTIFQEDLVNTYRHFLDQRRAARPAVRVTIVGTNMTVSDARSSGSTHGNGSDWSRSPATCRPHRRGRAERLAR
jgi:hypothetical protein